mmetsp:Transcript_17437/g.26337  ORF Transcript_17437/g.26337 Transcript_17437/m.26337 type:complete len:133 (-) Transcript_17437:110-508(-)
MSWEEILHSCVGSLGGPIWTYGILQVISIVCLFTAAAATGEPHFLWSSLFPLGLLLLVVAIGKWKPELLTVLEEPAVSKQKQVEEPRILPTRNETGAAVSSIRKRPVAVAMSELKDWQLKEANSTNWTQGVL